MFNDQLMSIPRRDIVLKEKKKKDFYFFLHRSRRESILLLENRVRLLKLFTFNFLKYDIQEEENLQAYKLHGNYHWNWISYIFITLFDPIQINGNDFTRLKKKRKK